MNLQNQSLPRLSLLPQYILLFPLSILPLYPLPGLGVLFPPLLNALPLVLEYLLNLMRLKDILLVHDIAPHDLHLLLAFLGAEFLNK